MYTNNFPMYVSMYVYMYYRCSSDDTKARVYVDGAGGVSDIHGNLTSRTLQLPTTLLAYIFTSWLGKYLMYPGCIQLLQLAIGEVAVWVCECLIRDVMGYVLGKVVCIYLVVLYRVQVKLIVFTLTLFFLYLLFNS